MKITQAQYERIAGNFLFSMETLRQATEILSAPFCISPKTGANGGSSRSSLGNSRRYTKSSADGQKAGYCSVILRHCRPKNHFYSSGSASVDSISCKVYPDGHGELKNPGLRNRKIKGRGERQASLWYLQMIRSSLQCTSPAENVTTDRKDEPQLRKPKRSSRKLP